MNTALELADIASLDFDKSGGLLPAIVQHAESGAVLMLGFMDRDALRATLVRRRVVFFSRSRQRLWEKGETSGNTLGVTTVRCDCDRDTLLVTALPAGPVCHLGTATCFGGEAPGGAANRNEQAAPRVGEGAPRVAAAGRLAFLSSLEAIIAQRIADRPQSSYTARLFAQGAKRMAQKVGEEGLEVALAAIAEPDDKLIAESADLLYHLLLLLKSRGLCLEQVVAELESRHARGPRRSTGQD